MLKLTGGEHRGRNLKWLDIPGIRPTPARVREAVFNIFSHELIDSHWWDLCCGSGVMGLEALSRGAKQVCFVDQNRRSLHLLRQNLEVLKLQHQARIIGANLGHFLKRQTELNAQFIYCDPPYDSPLYRPVVEELGQMPLAEGISEVVLILEYRRHQQNWDLSTPWQEIEQRNYGDTCLSFLRRTV